MRPAAFATLLALIALGDVGSVRADEGELPDASFTDAGVPDAATAEPLSPPPPPEVVDVPDLPPTSIDPPLAPEGPAPSAADLARAIVALVLILALAYVGGHPKIRELEERLRISHVVAAGFPFVILGVVARHPSAGFLSDSILDEIRPILPLGLGWIGFALGFRCDVRELEGPPPHLGKAFVLMTVTPFVLTFGGSALLLGLSAYSPGDGYLRHSLILGVASAISSTSGPMLAHTMLGAAAMDRVKRVVQLEQFAAVAALALIAAFFRLEGSAASWQLPGVAWLFVTLGLPVVLGAATYAVLSTVETRAETTLVMLGAICFASGMSSYLRLSPIIVCFVAALLLANVPGAFKEQVRDALDRLEGPIYLLFLFLAGAHWRVGDWQGWALVGVFVSTRIVGRAIAATVLRFRLGGAIPSEERRALVFSPLGALAIAAAVNAQDLYPGVQATWVLTAVIGGGIVNEIIVQAFGRGTPEESPQGAA